MIGRGEQLDKLNSFYVSDSNNLTVLYGRYRVGKTALIKEFIKDKHSFYYEAGPTVDFEQIKSLNAAVNAQTDGCSYSVDYDGIFNQIKNSNIEVLVFEEFQYMIKADLGFMVSLLRFMQEIEHTRKVMVILTSSSVSWVENSMVKTIKRAALSINAFIKVREFNYSDTVEMFPECKADELLGIYAVTGGVCGYLSKWNPKESIKENVCRLFLDHNGFYARESELFIKEEFRETGVYSTILKCLACGMNKLNEIHEYTGYGRDKISVYLKNMIEREIVEKVFSYDGKNAELTKKGLYRIKDDFINFWYKFVYPNYGILAVTTPENFYERYIEPDFDEFRLEAFIKIAGEFLDIINAMGRLPVKCEKKGRWHGKAGDLHIIYEGGDGSFIIGQVFVGNHPVGVEEYNAVLSNAEIAGMKKVCVYAFSACGFALELLDMEGQSFVPVRIEDL